MIMAILGFGLASCEKCIDCTCVGTNEFEFESGFSAEDQSTIETAYTRDFEDTSESFCDRSQDEVDAFEDEWETKTRSFFEEQVLNGLDWSVQSDYICSCVEQE